MQFSHYLCQSYQKGFTLIETIVGIVVLAISFSVLTTLIYPISQQSADQLHQVKAAELAQSVLNEIQNKAFDNNSDMAGGRVRCGEGADDCSTAMGVEGTETRATFNDVDDYNDLLYAAGEIENSQGVLLELYIGYSMNVNVCNDPSYSGSCTNDISKTAISTAKLITVTITTPTKFSLSFSTYRANF
jgi:MSHA pilin protein MshD